MCYPLSYPKQELSQAHQKYRERGGSAVRIMVVVMDPAKPARWMIFLGLQGARDNPRVLSEFYPLNTDRKNGWKLGDLLRNFGESWYFLIQRIGKG